MHDTLIIIPAFNEEKNIGGVLRELHTYAKRLAVDILVVNDGSVDNTAAITGQAGAIVISLPFNLGYGGALQTGFKYAVQHHYRYAVQFDADGQHDPLSLQSIISSLRDEKADIVIGSRFLAHGSFRIGILKKTVIRVLQLLIKLATGVWITDPSSGLKGLSARTFHYFAKQGNFPNDYPDADVIIHMLLSNYRVIEVGACMRSRQAGKSMHSGLKPLFYLYVMAASMLIAVLHNRTKMKGSELDG